MIDLPIAPRFTAPDERIDAIRGALAIERGPLVYCLETADLPGPIALEDVRLDAAARPVDVPRPDLGDDVVGVATGATVRSRPEPAWPYPPERAPGGPGTDWTGEVPAVPYLVWANRGPGGMRVWVPRATADEPAERSSG
jgi:DUF1680 family protein